MYVYIHYRTLLYFYISELKCSNLMTHLPYLLESIVVAINNTGRCLLGVRYKEIAIPGIAHSITVNSQFTQKNYFILQSHCIT